MCRKNLKNFENSERARKVLGNYLKKKSLVFDITKVNFITKNTISKIQKFIVNGVEVYRSGKPENDSGPIPSTVEIFE